MKTQFIALSVLSCLLAIGFEAPARAELVGYWSFDDDNAVDLSGNNNDGNVGSLVSFDPEVPDALAGGKSVFVNAGGGSNGAILVPNSPTLESITDQLTIAFWVRSTESQWPNWGRVFEHGTEGNGSHTWMVNRHGSTTDVNLRVDTVAGPPNPSSGLYPGFNQNIGYSSSDPDTLIDDTWHHWVMTLDNGSWKKYVDGSLALSGTYTHGDGFGNSRPFVMLGRDGGGNGSNNFGGYIDDVSLWNTAISPWAVEQLYLGAAATAIPEPASALLLALGGVGLAFSSRRRRRS